MWAWEKKQGKEILLEGSRRWFARRRRRRGACELCGSKLHGTP